MEYRKLKTQKHDRAPTTLERYLGKETEKNIKKQNKKC